MSLALLFHYLMLNMFRMLVHPSSGACDLFDEILIRCVLVLPCGFAGVVWCGMVSGYHTTPAEPQRNTNTHRTRAIQPTK